MDIEIFRVVNVLVGTVLDRIEYSRLQVEQYSSGDVASVVRLIEENVFSVAALSRKVFEIAVLADAMLLTKLLPELLADCIVFEALANIPLHDGRS